MSDGTMKGWWQASDGKWYPPEQHPDYRPQSRPLPPPTGPLQPRQPGTGASAPRPRKTKGKRWPWVVGGVVVVVVVAALASGDDSPSVRLDATASPSSTAGAAIGGQPLGPSTTQAGSQSATGIIGDTFTAKPTEAKLTVMAFEMPVTPSNRFAQPKAGFVFAAVDFKGCAGPQGDRFGFNPLDFKLQMPDDTRIESAFSTAKEPELHSDPLGPNDCVRGWITFEVPTNLRPSYVVHSQSFGAVAKWRI